MKMPGVLRKLFGVAEREDPGATVALTDIAPAWNRAQAYGVYYDLGPVMRGQLNRDAHYPIEGWH